MSDVEEFLRESNRIEGEGDDAYPDSLRVWNYLSAFKELSVQDVLIAHGMLMRSRDTISPQDKGVFTRYQTSVGGRNNPEPFKVPALMDAWVHDINMSILIADIPETVAKRFHVRFEHIHPFLDGNGRIGRILYNWHRLRLGLPVHVIKYADRHDYYKWF